MKIRGKLFIPNQTKKLKALFVIWAIGLLVIFLGGHMLLDSKLTGVALMATAIALMPFIVKSLTKV